jgi:hypothetical protein
VNEEFNFDIFVCICTLTNVQLHFTITILLSLIFIFLTSLLLHATSKCESHVPCELQSLSFVRAPSPYLVIGKYTQVSVSSRF